MSQFGAANYQGIPLEDRIPESAKIVGNQVSMQSIITDRKTVKYNASNGSTFGPNQTPRFKISSNTDFPIPSTANLHFNFVNKTKTEGGANSISSTSDDSPLSVLNRGSVKVGGVQVEDVLDMNKVVNLMIESHMNQSHYNREAGIKLKTWKWNSGYNTETYNYVPLNLPSNGVGDINDGVNTSLAAVEVLLNQFRHDAVGVAQRQANRSEAIEHETNEAKTPKPVEINLPLSFLFGLFRSNTLFPLPYTSDMEIDFILESAVKAIVSTITSDVADYEINDVYLTMDMCSVTGEYLNLLQRSFMSEGHGYTLPIDTFTTSNGTAVSAGMSDVTFSKSTPFLKSIYFGLTDSAWDSSIYEYSITGNAYRLDDSPNMRLRVGSKPYPEYDSLRSKEEIFRQAQIAMGHFSNVADNIGLASQETWKGKDSDNSHFYVHFGFEKVVGLGADYYQMDTYDASLSGGVITLSANYLANTRVLAVFEHVRVLKFANNAINVSG